ncbi:MAG: type II toxin-antitoxin system RelE/ParE family toxin [Rhodospirillales bacterium]|nr:type II toxin-antitoxin system RelE/ParE family toxin [Rhodospirillales bacterium]
MKGRYRLTRAADSDIEGILAESGRLFGPLQRERYARLIEQAVEWVAGEPDRPGSRPREELCAGVRSFHVELAAGRRGAASHLVYYVRGRMADGGDGIVVLRVLHERMDPLLHVLEEGRLTPAP